MRLVDRAKNLIVTPRTEWDAIAVDPTPTAQIITGYVLPLAGLAALARFIGMAAFTPMGIVWALGLAVYNVVMAVVFVYVVGFIIEALAPTFGGHKDRPQAIKLAAYSYTPAWLAGLFMLFPFLGMLVVVGAIYGLYLLYLGLPKLMKNPADKSAGYTALVVVCAIVVGFIIGAIGAMFTAPAMLLTSGPAITYDRKGSAKLDEFARKMEEASRKMEAAQKSGDAGKQMEAAMGALGTALSGGQGVEPVQLDVLKPMLPEKAGGLPRVAVNADRSGVAGLMAAKVEGIYQEAANRMRVEIVDTGGAAGLMGLAAWATLASTSESETADRIERLRRDGKRMVREEISKTGGQSSYAVILRDRFVVTAKGRGDVAALKAAVESVDLAKLEAIK